MSWIDLVLALVIGSSVRWLDGRVRARGRGLCGDDRWDVWLLVLWNRGCMSSITSARERSANLIGFFVIWRAYWWWASSGTSWQFFKWVGLSWLDRLLGGAFGIVRVSLIGRHGDCPASVSPSPPSAVGGGFKLLPYVIDVANVLAALTPHEMKEQFYATKDKVKADWSAHNARRAEGSARMNLLIFDLEWNTNRLQARPGAFPSTPPALMHLEPISEDLTASYVGNGALVLMQRALGPEASAEDVAQALDYFLSYYRAHMLDNTRLYPGVREALDRLLEGNAKMAVLTNKPVRFSRSIVAGLGLEKHFFQVYGGNSFEQKKPDRSASKPPQLFPGRAGIDGAGGAFHRV